MSCHSYIPGIPHLTRANQTDQSVHFIVNNGLTVITYTDFTHCILIDDIIANSFLEQSKI